MTSERKEAAILDLIGRWHEGHGDGRELWEFLGMTREQYAAWVELKGLPEGYEPPICPHDVTDADRLRAWRGNWLRWIPGMGILNAQTGPGASRSFAGDRVEEAERRAVETMRAAEGDKP